jgi:hypothetical protein
MLDDSLFAGSDLVTDEVDLGKGKVTMHFRELPATEFYACFVQPAEGGKKALSPAHLIAASLRNPDGSPAITAERAAQLKNKPFNALFNAVMRVNGESGGNDSPGEGNAGSGTS